MEEVNPLYKQCLACKLISSSVLVASGIYVGLNFKSAKSDVGRLFMKGIAGTMIGLGIIRLMDFNPCPPPICRR